MVAAFVFVVGKAAALILAAASILVFLYLVHRFIGRAQPLAAEQEADLVKQRRRGVKALVMGADGRTSTSKLQAVLWTFTVLYAFLFLLLWGRSFGCGIDDLTEEQVASCNQAADDRVHFAEVTGRELQEDYYVLLGFPLGVAVAARALTTSKIASGSIVKEPNETSTGVASGLREVISNDDGETDLVDFQYFAFNLVALAFVWVEFLTDPSTGLPDLPATLVGLTGLSAAAYTTRKAVAEEGKPGISSLIPERIALAAGGRITVIGTGFESREVLATPDETADRPPIWVSEPAWVKLDGISLAITGWTSTRIDAALTQEVVDRFQGTTTWPAGVQIVVDLEDGRPSEPYDAQLVQPPGAGG